MARSKMMVSCLTPMVLVAMLVRATDSRGNVLGVKLGRHGMLVPEPVEDYRDYSCDQLCNDEPDKYPGCLNMLVKKNENVTLWLDYWLSPGPFRDLVAGPIGQEDHILMVYGDVVYE